MPNNLESDLVIPDLHIPFVDKKFLAIITKILKEFTFNRVIILGDMLDFPQISTFSKDPSRKEDIFDDIKRFRRILLRWQGIVEEKNPNAEFHLLEGNHEFRFIRYIWNNAGPIHGAIKSIPELLDFYNLPLRTHWHEYSNLYSCLIHNVLYHHGVYYNRHTAVNNLGVYRGIGGLPLNFIQGHTHRFQYASNGSNWSATLGFGANSQTQHKPVPSDWQLALGIVDYCNKVGFLSPCLIEGNTAIVRGKVIKAW